MSIFEKVSALSTGAQFVRADLHSHSHGASHDVSDAKMTPAAVVATAALEGLSLVAITDHNEIGNVQAAIAAAQGTSVCVIPGVELSTSQGHLLCYLPTLEALNAFHGRLTLAERGTQTSRCQQSVLECLNLLQALGGFGVLAHVDIATGYEMVVPGAGPHKTDVICHAALLGIELRHASSDICYAPGDPDQNRIQMGKTRIERLKLGAQQHLARVLNSDAHALDALGRNAAHARKVTRYKMDRPSFEGLRIALENADARVRIEDVIPAVVPCILGLDFDGGFLAEQTIHFSPNLNCIIGGRGTGKSTTFEALRCLANEPGDCGSVVDSEVWPEEIQLLWCDQAGQRHHLIRPKDYAVHREDEPDGPCSFDIDCFGQGEAARISAQAQRDPLALLRYLDKFVQLKEAAEAEDEARERLLKLQTAIEEATKQVELIPQFQRDLTTTQRQLTALQKPEVKDLIELHRQVAAERELRSEIAEKMNELKNDAGMTSSTATLVELHELGEAPLLAVGDPEFRAILAGAQSFATAIAASEKQIKSSLAAFERLVATQTTAWKAKEDEAQKKVDAKRKELEAMKVQFDMSYIAKLTKDEASHKQTLKNLDAWKKHLALKLKERAAVLKARWSARDRVATSRDAFALQATKTLREALTDLHVSLKYQRNAHSPEAAELIIGAMGWRTNQQVRASWLVETLTVPALLDAIQRKDVSPLTALRTGEGAEVFDAGEAQAILDRLSFPATKFALERVKLHDLPKLLVSRKVSGTGQQARYRTREFSQLSLGQQQSVLLALILSADSNRPLLIDQPEDNLDGEFIYSTLVPVLRRAKERRQVIVVTHNANVAVLGDAELIVVMKAGSDRGQIMERGSIDHPPTRDAACAILEGARDAFVRRAKMYGMKISVG